MNKDMDTLARIIERAERGLLDLISKRVRGAKVFSIGVGLSPEHLALWIRTSTDNDRDALRADAGILLSMREILRKEHYPKEAIEKVELAIESDETVDRDWGGRWHDAVR